MSKNKDAAHWRELVAAAATVDIGHVTQSSPKGFGEALGQRIYYFVKLGPLVLRHDGEWDWLSKEAKVQARLAYAHKTVMSALAALRAEVEPDEPACAEALESIYKMGKQQ